MKNRFGKGIPDLFFCIAMCSEEAAGGRFYVSKYIREWNKVWIKGHIIKKSKKK